MEKWIEIEGYEGYYEVSDLGRIRSIERLVPHGTKFQYVEERILKLKILKSGYVHVAMNKDGIRRTKSVHRLVAKAFLPNWDVTLQINHIDGDKTNNKVSNLEVCTASENQKHAISIGLVNVLAGEKNGHAKLTNQQANGIRILKSEYSVPTSLLASVCNVCPTTIRRITQNLRYIK